MRGKVIVRTDETIGQALKRLHKQVAGAKASDKWPTWLGCYAKPSEKRCRKQWLLAMKRKRSKVFAERHDG